MKKLILSLCVAMMAIAVSFAQDQTTTVDQKKVDKRAPVITFSVTEHDFGTFEQGGNGTYDFEFKNTGKEPLIVNNVQTSCGCTVPEWPKDPIAKGKSGAIKVKYDTQRLGSFTKTITVMSNAKNSPIVLKITGNINPKSTQTTPTK